MTTPRLLFVGLDCVPPHLAFGSLASAMPTLRRLRRMGASGPLRSTTPPITIPAWASMLTGRDPGELGLYGFRNRVLGTHELRTATSADVAHPFVWETLADRDLRASAFFVPPSYPPRAHPGQSVSCLLTPSADVAHTHPSDLPLATRYVPDLALTDEEAADPDRVIDRLAALVDNHFRIAIEHVRQTRLDLFAMVEIATDRLHHHLYRFLDAEDPRHDPDPRLGRRVRDLYARIDQRLESLIEAFGPSDVMIASDHGARPLLGGVRVNRWLADLGLLHWRDGATGPEIDWAKSEVVGEGGYYARIFFQRAGIDPEGRVDEARANELHRVLEDALARLVLPTTTARGRASIGAHSYRVASTLYRSLRGRAPDAMIFFGDLAYRSLGGLEGPLFATADEVDRDRGRGGCNHDWDGIFIDARRGGRPIELDGARILDVAPTILARFGVTDTALSGRVLRADGRFGEGGRP